MNLKNYIKTIKLFATIYNFYLLRIFLYLYFNGSIIQLHCVLNGLIMGFSCGLLFCGVTEFLNWSPFEPLILSSDETNILNNDYNTIEISEKNLKNQEEIKDTKKNLSAWLIMSTVFWCTLLVISITADKLT
jgi:hypothetical protein